MREERGDGCGATILTLDAGPVRAVMDGRTSCDPDAPGDSLTLVVTEPQGRLYVVWERQEGEHPYSELAVAHPPRVVQWHEDEHGCWMAVAVAGARDHDCPIGGPPPPPGVAWGRLLP